MSPLNYFSSAACQTQLVFFPSCYSNTEIPFNKLSNIDFSTLLLRKMFPSKQTTVIGQQQLALCCLPKFSACSQHLLTLQCKYQDNGFCTIIEQSSLTLKAHFVNNSLLSEILLLLLILSEQCATLDNQRSATHKVYLRSRSIRYFIKWKPSKMII